MHREVFMLHKRLPALLVTGSMLLSLGSCEQGADPASQTGTAEETAADVAVVADPE